MKRFLFISFAIALLSSTATAAQYFPNKASWDSMGIERKNGFVAGFMEADTVELTGQDLYNLYRQDH